MHTITQNQEKEDKTTKTKNHIFRHVFLIFAVCFFLAAFIQATLKWNK